MKVQIVGKPKYRDHDGGRSLGDLGFTLVHPFYNEKQRFDLQFETWLEWPERLREKVRIVVIDDGSPSPVLSWLTPSKMKRIGSLKLSIYRVLEDLKWNTPGALNLGFMTAPTEFVLCMDSDCAFNAFYLEKFLHISPREDSIYLFPRKREGEKDENIHNTRYLPCSMLMHKNVFLAVNGFDEDFTGARSGNWGFFDNDFIRKAKTAGYRNYIWRDVEATEWMPSVCGPPLQRERSQEVGNKKLMYQKWNGEVPIGREILRFPWKKVF